MLIKQDFHVITHQLVVDREIRICGPDVYLEIER